MFFSAKSLSFILLTSIADAQQAYNTILNPGANSVIQAGGGVQSLTWSNLTSGNVSVSLFSGANPVVEVTPILTNVLNTGTALWTPETWLPSGNDYLIGVTDLSGTAPIQYSPYFTIELCETCSSSTRSSTSSFPTQTVSVSGLNLGTRSALAFPTIAAAASAAAGSGSVTQTGVVASGAAASIRAGASNMASGSGFAGVAQSLGSSANAILSMTSGAAAASGSGSSDGSASTTTTRSGAGQIGASLFMIMVAAGFAL